MSNQLGEARELIFWGTRKNPQSSYSCSSAISQDYSQGHDRLGSVLESEITNYELTVNCRNTFSTTWIRQLFDFILPAQTHQFNPLSFTASVSTETRWQTDRECYVDEDKISIQCELNKAALDCTFTSNEQAFHKDQSNYFAMI